MHSQKCEACDVLSRQDHRKEGKLISQVWDNVTASETANGKYIINICIDTTPKKCMTQSIQKRIKKQLVIQEKWYESP